MKAVTHSTRVLMRMICVTASIIMLLISIVSIQKVYAACDTRADASSSLGRIAEKAGILVTSAHSVDRYISRVSSSNIPILPIIVKKRGSAVHGFSRGDHDTLQVIIGWLFLPIFFGFEHPLVFCFVLFCLSVLYIIVEEYRSERNDRGIKLTRQGHS